MVDSNSEFLELTWHLDEGVAGVDSSYQNPLARAVASLFRHGRPFPRLSMCFFKRRLSSAINRWLGVLVHSEGDRILFFPGFAQEQSNVRGSIFDRDVSSPVFKTDHVSLEKNHKSWHLTSSESADHIGRFPTVDLGHSRTFWFALSVANERLLRLVREDTVVTEEVPSIDADRRAAVFIEAREGAQFSTISLNSSDFRRGHASFLHFAFIVGPKDFPEYTGPAIGIDLNSPFLESPLPADTFPLPQRTHPVELSPDVELRIICTEVPGRLTIPFVYSAGRQNK